MKLNSCSSSLQLSSENLWALNYPSVVQWNKIALPFHCYCQMKIYKFQNSMHCPTQRFAMPKKILYSSDSKKKNCWKSVTDLYSKQLKANEQVSYVMILPRNLDFSIWLFSNVKPLIHQNLVIILSSANLKSPQANMPKCILIKVW